MPGVRVTRRQFGAASAAALAGLALPRRPRLPAAPAERLLRNGQVLTVDARFTVAEAVAIGEGRILGTGTASALRPLLGPGTEVIDLGGRTVLPGINDSHLHCTSWGLTRPPYYLDLGFPTVTSIADVVAQVRAAATSRPPEQWIRGRGWDVTYFAEGRQPTRQDLDAVAPEHPVVLFEFSGHAVWVNSRALALAGITRESVPPAGGVIVKDATGEPTGLLFEGATGPVYRVLPDFTEAERVRAIEEALAALPAEGITSFTEPGTDQFSLGVYARLAREGKLTSRITALVRGGNSTAALEQVLAEFQPLRDVDPRQLRVTGIKLFADGIPTGNRTAWLSEAYVGGGLGSLTVDGATDAERLATLRGLIAMAHRAGFQVGTHATGDAAIAAAVEAYVDVMSRMPRSDPRHYIIHGDLARPGTLRLMARHGIGANFNASIKQVIADGQPSAIGAERAAYEWPYRTALDLGVHVSSASDAPVTVPNWRQGLATCLARRGRKSGKVFGPEQRITLAEAVRTYTTGGAWQDYAETWKGTLEPGMAADLCVVDGRLLETDPDVLPTVPVLLTIAGGRVVYDGRRG